MNKEMIEWLSEFFKDNQVDYKEVLKHAKLRPKCEHISNSEQMLESNMENVVIGLAYIIAELKDATRNRS